MSAHLLGQRCSVLHAKQIMPSKGSACAQLDCVIVLQSVICGIHFQLYFSHVLVCHFAGKQPPIHLKLWAPVLCWFEITRLEMTQICSRVNTRSIMDSPDSAVFLYHTHHQLLFHGLCILRRNKKRENHMSSFSSPYIKHQLRKWRSIGTKCWYLPYKTSNPSAASTCMFPASILSTI